MISAILIINSKAETVLTQHYRDDVRYVLVPCRAAGIAAAGVRWAPRSLGAGCRLVSAPAGAGAGPPLAASSQRPCAAVSPSTRSARRWCSRRTSACPWSTWATARSSTPVRWPGARPCRRAQLTDTVPLPGRSVPGGHHQAEQQPGAGVPVPLPHGGRVQVVLPRSL
jgi:hypothetical protein